MEKVRAGAKAGQGMPGFAAEKRRARRKRGSARRYMEKMRAGAKAGQGMPGYAAEKRRARRNRGSARPYISRVEMMPEPSRMVRIWLAGTLGKRSIFCVVGHFTSIRSANWDLPRPKWRRRSDWHMTLPPEWTSSIWE